MPTPIPVKDQWVTARADADLVAAVKSASAEDGVTVGRFIRALLEEELKSRGIYPPSK